MNKILQLKGKLTSSRSTGRPGRARIPVDAVVKTGEMERLADELEKIKLYWLEKEGGICRCDLIGGVLISVLCPDVMAKSNRIKELFAELETVDGVRNISSANSKIVGAKFVETKPGKVKHEFTYFLQMQTVEGAIDKLRACASVAADLFGDEIKDSMLALVSGEVSDNQGAKSGKDESETQKAARAQAAKERDKEQDNIKDKLKKVSLSRTTFCKVVADTYRSESFFVNTNPPEKQNDRLVTLYRTGVPIASLCSRIGLDYSLVNRVDDTTLLMGKHEYRLLREKAPYLIAMSMNNRHQVQPADFLEPHRSSARTIAPPDGEPVIGVLDAGFDSKAYFSAWVEHVNLLSDGIELEETDKDHGTSVCSIIVDGPGLNPDLDDGCGHFRVKLFTVAKADRFSSFSLMKNVSRAVRENPQIKVWNLSFGSEQECERFSISPEGAMLDDLQRELDICVVVSGTNFKRGNAQEAKRIGAPADSINSLVVNSVKRDGKPASYSRKGPVLEFFHKPDLCCFGGDKLEWLNVWTTRGLRHCFGTSYAAPWATRKLAYLMLIMGMTREAAKALLIHAAAGWHRQDDAGFLTGFGVLPQDIRDVVYSQDDEIKFIINGESNAYDTSTYDLPVPVDGGKHPFFCRATLCYFPRCNRNQGVDYTSTELDLHLGRVTEKKSTASDGSIKQTVTIKSINDNSQSDEDGRRLYEGNARAMFRKWDNVKHISENLNPRARPKEAYGAGNWGLSVKAKERLDDKVGRGMKFAVVVTLKEMNGKNRFNEFKRLCQLHGWLVNELEPKLMNELQLKGEEELIFE